MFRVTGVTVSTLTSVYKKPMTAEMDIFVITLKVLLLARSVPSDTLQIVLVRQLIKTSLVMKMIVEVGTMIIVST